MSSYPPASSASLMAGYKISRVAGAIKPPASCAARKRERQNLAAYSPFRAAALRRRIRNAKGPSTTSVCIRIWHSRSCRATLRLICLPGLEAGSYSQALYRRFPHAGIA